ncbi:flagellar basal-body MS-ring/collar protein FliF [Fibrobacterales bacterium]|nr:flagellar basal-body MS-ring/collar protein FliF [Fibrobacterales bacterium]
MGGSSSKNGTLFSNLSLDEASKVTAFLKDQGYQYELDNNGRTIMVNKKSMAEVRMDLARNGLPENGGTGYELFDDVQLGVTDFVQNLNYKRALEGELQRSIESLHEVEFARIHLTVPKETIFSEKKEESRASVIVKVRPGKELGTKQVKGITYLVASAVEGLKSRQVTVVDSKGNMLTQGFAGDEVAEHTDHNMSMQRSVEKHMESKVRSILGGVLGPNKARVKISVEMDFDQVQKKIESFDPKKKVVRSEQRDDGTRKNSPAVGDEVKEGSITNYEIDRTIASVVASPGATKRLTVSVAVDGTYEAIEGKRTFVPRSEEEIQVLTRLVKTAVGYDGTRTDEVYVASMQFDNSHLDLELAEIDSMKNEEYIKQGVQWGIIVIIIILGFWALRKVVGDVIVAMNPPLPRYAGIDLEVEEEEETEDMRRQADMLERMEMATRDDPAAVAELIRAWLQDGGSKK